jgi:hypothetical protein
MCTQHFARLGSTSLFWIVCLEKNKELLRVIHSLRERIVLVCSGTSPGVWKGSARKSLKEGSVCVMPCLFSLIQLKRSKVVAKSEFFSGKESSCEKQSCQHLTLWNGTTFRQLWTSMCTPLYILQNFVASHCSSRLEHRSWQRCDEFVGSQLSVWEISKWPMLDQ